MTSAIVQSDSIYSANPFVSSSLSLPGTVPGNAIVLAVTGTNGYNGTIGIQNPVGGSGIDDSVNNGLYQLVWTQRDLGFGVSWNQVYIVPAGIGGDLTIDVMNYGGDNISVVAYEITNLTGAVDASSVSASTTNFGIGTDSLTSGVLAQADELLLALITGVSGSNALTLNTPSGFTSDFLNNGTAGSNHTPGVGIAHKIVSATTAVTSAWVSSTSPSGNPYSFGGRMSLVALKSGAPVPYFVSAATYTPSHGQSLVLTGAGLTGADTVDIGGTNQTVTGRTSSTITITVNRGANPYGEPLACTITNVNGTSNARNITILPPAGWSYINLGTVNATAAYRITAIPDLASGNQLAYENNSNKNEVFNDASFVADIDVVSFDVEAWTLDGWGTVATQTMNLDASQVTITGGTLVNPGGSVTLTISTNSPLTGAQNETVSLSDGAGGSFSPSSVSLSSSQLSATTSYTPTSSLGGRTVVGSATGTPTLVNGSFGLTVVAPPSEVVITGADDGIINVAQNLTVRTDNALINAQTEAVTLSDGAGGSFSPNPANLSSSVSSVVVSYTPIATGLRTVTGTASGTPSISPGTHDVDVVAVPTEVTITGPSSAASGGGATLTISTDVLLLGSQTEAVTLSDGTGGLFSPNPVNLSSSVTSATVSYIPTAEVGARTVVGSAVGTPTIADGEHLFLVTEAQPSTPTNPIKNSAASIGRLVDVSVDFGE